MIVFLLLLTTTNTTAILSETKNLYLFFEWLRIYDDDDGYAIE